MRTVHLLALTLACAAWSQAPPRDRNGDPLPYGALARLGRRPLRHPHAIQALAFAPTGDHLVSAGDSVRLWHVPSGTLRWRLDRPSQAVAMLPGGAVAAGGRGGVSLYQPPGHEPVAVLPSPGVVDAVALSPDGAVLAWCSYAEADDQASNQVYAWDLAAGAPLGDLGPLSGRATTMRFSDDGAQLAVASLQGEVVRIDLATGARHPPVAVPQAPGGAPPRVSGLAFTRGGARLSAAFPGFGIRTWDLREGQVAADARFASEGAWAGPVGLAAHPLRNELLVLRRGLSSVPPGGLGGRELFQTSRSGSALAVQPQLARAALGLDSGEIHVLDLETEAELGRDGITVGMLGAAAWSPAGDQLALGDARTVRFFRPDGAPLAHPTDLEALVWNLAYSPGGDWVAAATEGGEVALVLAGGGPPQLRMRLPEAQRFVAVRGDAGEVLVAAGRSGTIRWRRSDTGEADGSPLETGVENLMVGAYHRPSGTLAVAPRRGGVVLVDAHARAVLAELPGCTSRLDGRPGKLHSLDFSGDGEALVYGCDDRVVVVPRDPGAAAVDLAPVEAAPRPIPGRPLARTTRAWFARFHPDGRRVYMRSVGLPIRLAAAEDGRPLGSVAYTDGVPGIPFAPAPDGSGLALLAGDVAYVWAAEP